MQVKVLEQPIKHIVIENFLSKDELLKSYNEILRMKEGFQEGEWYHHEEGLVVDHSRKKCLNLDPYLYFKDMEKESFLITEVIPKLWDQKLREIYDGCGTDSVFSYLNDTNVDFALLTSYRDGDYYHWHKDIGVTTANIMIGDPDIDYEGGEFELCNVAREAHQEKMFGDEFESVSYDFVPGRVVIFPARFRHRVKEVKVNGNQFENYRFTLQSRSFVRD